ncbi:MAG TPA: hypothetical protein VL654_08570 [Casimicrobiaceae bacterium]|jgi:hypothetical protein|nr:hypothetical protein [Casimicrobiaceae bacterium]
MKTLLALSIACAAAALCGCAPAPYTKADVDGRIVCNTDRMDQVERAARREMKEIHWLNCPLATLRVAS